MRGKEQPGAGSLRILDASAAAISAAAGIGTIPVDMSCSKAGSGVADPGQGAPQLKSVPSISSAFL